MAPVKFYVTYPAYHRYRYKFYCGSVVLGFRRNRPTYGRSSRGTLRRTRTKTLCSVGLSLRCQLRRGHRRRRVNLAVGIAHTHRDPLADILLARVRAHSPSREPPILLCFFRSMVHRWCTLPCARLSSLSLPWLTTPVPPHAPALRFRTCLWRSARPRVAAVARG